MIIDSVTIENFRCYYGKNTLQLNANGKVTLIYGDSGFGKSSLLQFFRWMFYGDPDFGPNNDKPLFNTNAFNELKPGEKTKVEGKIDFQHLGIKYSLVKTVYFDYAINPNNARISSTDYTLQHLVGDSWQRYTGDVSNKINTILPKGLSKYFLLDGERARDIVLNSDDLKQAIHQLFGLDAYALAIKHLGKKQAKASVIGYYQSELVKNTEQFQTYNNMTLPELQEAVSDLNDLIELAKNAKKETKDQIDQLKARRDEILKILGQANNKNSIQLLIKANEEAIKEAELKIASLRHQIGDLFYSNYPYLFLSRLTSQSSKILREKNELFAQANNNVFESLNKELIKEILHKHTCVCGRDLDDESTEKLNAILAVMPPDSYAYQFGQFINSSKSRIALAETEIMRYEELQSRINDLEQKIIQLQDQNNEKLNELKRLDDAKALVEELERIDTDIKALEKKKSGIEADMAKKIQLFNISSNQIEKLLKNSTVSETYTKKIDFFTKILVALDQERRQQETKVKLVLNECVKEVFKQLTTQTELDVDKIKFVNDDFSLRTTYLTGGQLAVDEYSYVIGIIKALQEMKMENNESPIVIDAPFAFTGTEQSEHIFKTLPAVSKQTILLTLDLNKIKNLLGQTDLYDFYVIKNETQDMATIERSSINDIKF